MFRLLLLVGAFALGFWIFQQTLPDIQRYLKLRSM
jgi:hypothetical protein